MLRNSDIKGFILTFSLMSSLLLNSGAVAIEANDLKKISFNKISDKIIEVRLETDKLLPSDPIVYERGKNVYFIALNSTTYNGDRKIDIKDFDKLLSNATVDFIPYKSQDSGYTRILIKTQDDVKIRTFNTVKNKGKLGTFFTQKMLPTHNKALYYWLSKLAMVGCIAIAVATATGIVVIYLRRRRKIDEILDVNDVEIETVEAENVDVSVDLANFIAASAGEQQKTFLIDKDEESLIKDEDILDSLSFDESAVAISNDDDSEISEINGVDVADSVKVSSIENDKQVIDALDDTVVSHNDDIYDEVITKTPDAFSKEEDNVADDDFDELIEEGEKEEEFEIIEDEVLKNEMTEFEEKPATVFNEIIDNTEEIINNKEEMSDSGEKVKDEIPEEADDTNNHFETAKYKATSGSGLFASKTLDFSSKPAINLFAKKEEVDASLENDVAENRELEASSKSEIEDNVVIDEIFAEEEVSPQINSNSEQVAEMPEEQTVLDEQEILSSPENYDTATLDDIDEFLPDIPEEDAPSEFDIGGLDGIVASVPDEDELANDFLNELLENHSEENINKSDISISDVDSDVLALLNDISDVKDDENTEFQTDVTYRKTADEGTVEEVVEQTEEPVVVEEEIIEETADMVEEFVEQTEEPVVVEEEIIEETADTDEEVVEQTEEPVVVEEEIIEETADTDEEVVEQTEEPVVVEEEIIEETADTVEEVSVIGEETIERMFKSEDEETADENDISSEDFFVNSGEGEEKMEEYVVTDNFYKNIPEEEPLTDEYTENSFFKEDESTDAMPESEYEYIDDSEPIVIAEKEIEPDKLIYLIRHEGQFSLIGIVNGEVFVLNKFEDEPVKTKIKTKLNEDNGEQHIYIVKVDKWRALISVTNEFMENLLIL